MGHIALGGQYLGIDAGQFGFRLGGWIEGQDQNSNLKPNLDAEVANKTPKSTPDIDLAKNTNFDQKYILPKFSLVSSPESVVLPKSSLNQQYRPTKNRILKSNMRFWNYKLFFDVGCLIRASFCFRFLTSVQTSYQNIILLFRHRTILLYFTPISTKIKQNSTVSK